MLFNKRPVDPVDLSPMYLFLVLIHGCVPVDEFKGFLFELQIRVIGHIDALEHADVDRHVTHHIID